MVVSRPGSAALQQHTPPTADGGPGDAHSPHKLTAAARVVHVLGPEDHRTPCRTQTAAGGSQTLNPTDAQPLLCCEDCAAACAVIAEAAAYIANG